MDLTSARDMGNGRPTSIGTDTDSNLGSPLIMVIQRLTVVARDLESGNKSYQVDEVHSVLSNGTTNYYQPADAAIRRELKRLVGEEISNLSSEDLTGRIQRALDFARQSPNFGSSNQHCLWVIDNIVRELTGSSYDSFVELARCGAKCDGDGFAVSPIVIEQNSCPWYVGVKSTKHETVTPPSFELQPTSENDLIKRVVSAAIIGAFGQTNNNYYLVETIDNIVLTLADVKYAAAIRDQKSWVTFIGL